MYLFTFLANNYLFSSGAFLLNMFGGRMLFQDIQPLVHNHFYFKHLFIFCLFFIATKDINLSLILITIYIFLMMFLKDFKKDDEQNKVAPNIKDKLEECTKVLEDIKLSL
tara:strand:- start:1518 stop:1847 length:330 start_codon:yes stop_codon:yes gene_type:complete